MRISAHVFPAAGQIAACAAVFMWSIAASAEPVKVTGPASLTKALSDQGSAFRDAGVEIRIEASGGNAAAITALGDQKVDVAILPRALTAQEKSKYPTRRFFEIAVAAQAYVPVVAKNVWESGVRSVSKEQMQRIFEGKLDRWTELGGGEMAIKFFNPEMGTPAFDLLTTWLYEDPRRAPESAAEVVRGGGQAVRNTLEFTSGSVSLIPPMLADGKEIFALGIVDRTGKVLQPQEASLLDRSYPMGRPVFLIFGNRPSGSVRDFLDFIRSPAGREILTRGDLTPVGPKELQ